MVSKKEIAVDDELGFVYNQVIETIIGIRKEQGITQKELAKNVGLSESMVSNIEIGRVSPTLKTFLKYSQGLHINWTYTYRKSDK